MDSPIKFERIYFERIYTINRKVLEECSLPSKSAEDIGKEVEGHYFPLEKLNKLLAEKGLHEDFWKQISPRLDYHEALEWPFPDIPENEDFTFFVPRESSTSSTKHREGELGPLEKFLWLRQIESKSLNKLSHDCKIWLWCPDKGRAAYGRALIAPCKEGKEWSFTFRRIDEYPRRKQTPNFLNTQEEIYDELMPLIFPNDPQRPGKEEHGLIIIAGRTGVAKSKIARGLFEWYLKRHRKAERVPHLLTYEDPIEKYLDGLDQIDYTPREKGKDAVNVAEVVNDALRQTPKVLFVGETRAQEDWRKLLEFAGTGHLVITTTHAGTLTEAMANLLRATEANSATVRSELADRVLALIHLRGDKITLPGAEKPIQIVIPALWRRTPTGIKALMAESLSALLPHNPKTGEETHYSSIGRLWFARKLINRRIEREQWQRVFALMYGWLRREPPATTAESIESLLTDQQKQTLETEVIKNALKWDLEGI